MWAFWIVLALVTYLDSIFLDSRYYSAWYAFSTIIVTLSIFVWFRLDARDIGYEPSVGFKVFVVLLAFVAVPIYLIRHKGFKRFGLSVTRFAGLLALLMTFVIFVVPE